MSFANPFSSSRREFLGGAAAAAGFRLLPASAQPEAGRTDLALRAQVSTAHLVRGATAPATSIWSFGGTIPTILRAKRGEELRVRLSNDLPESTSIHWHGVRLPNAMDGVPGLTQSPVASGASFDYRFRLPDAGTYWFHPGGIHAAQTGRGLRGMLIVEEANPVGVDRDLLLFLEDWSLAPDGTASEADGPSHVTINARPSIDLVVRTNDRLRLRIVNAAAARAMALRIERHEPVVVATDGQPSEPFPARDSRVVLGPGNRIDLMLDAVLTPGSRAAILLQERQGESPIAQLIYENATARPTPLALPKRLPANSLPERLDFRSAARHEFSITDARNLPPVHERKPLFNVARARVVVLACLNRSDTIQSIHLHGHHFRLLDRLDDGWKPFWLDTLMIAPRQTERIAFLADNPGKWLIEVRPVATRQRVAEAWFEVM